MTLTMTLADSLQLTTDVLQAGVIETLATESKILAELPFMNIQGSGYTYNVENELSDVQFRTVGEVITAGHAGWETRTEALKILADEAIVDTFQVAVYNNINDLMAIETQLKSKALAHKFEKAFISGDESVDPKSFNGLDVRLIDEQKVEATEVVADDVDTLLDKVQGSVSALIMNKATRRQFVAENRKYITYTTNKFGAKLAMYGDTPIIDLEDEVLDQKGAIYAVRFGAKEAVCGLQNGGVQVKALGETDAAPQYKTRIEWFCGLAVFNDKTIAKRVVESTETP